MSSRAGKELARYLEPLTEKQRLYVESRLRGMSRVASATAAGIARPDKNANQFERSAAVKEAIRVGRELLASDVMFDRRKAHDMLMEAHANAATATEQIFAIKELIRLHGVAAPEVKELRHHHSLENGAPREVQNMSDDELLALAQLPSEQLPAIVDAEYVEVEGRDASPTEDSS